MFGRLPNRFSSTNNHVRAGLTRRFIRDSTVRLQPGDKVERRCAIVFMVNFGIEYRSGLESLVLCRGCDKTAFALANSIRTSGVYTDTQFVNFARKEE